MVDANMPDSLVQAQNVVLQTGTSPAYVRAAAWAASQSYPKAAACLNKRADELERAGAPTPTTPPAPGPVPPFPLPPGVGWPPTSWPIPQLPGGDVGLVQTTVRPNDTAAGYAQFYASRGAGDAQAILSQMQADNPQLQQVYGVHVGGWAGWQAGKTLHLRSQWVALAGLPPLPTSQYQGGAVSTIPGIPGLPLDPGALGGLGGWFGGAPEPPPPAAPPIYIPPTDGD